MLLCNSKNRKRQGEQKSKRSNKEKYLYTTKVFHKKKIQIKMANCLVNTNKIIRTIN